MFSVAGLNRSSPSSFPGKAEQQFVNSSKIVKFLLKTIDGIAGRPGLAILRATYTSAKIREHKGSISSHWLYGQLLLTRF